MFSRQGARNDEESEGENEGGSIQIAVDGHKIPIVVAGSLLITTHKTLLLVLVAGFFHWNNF